MFPLVIEKSVSSLMNWVAFCATMEVLDQIVNSVNDEMERKKKEIDIISCRDIIFSLEWNEQEQRYFTLANINDTPIEEINGKVCAEFDEAFYMQMYEPIKAFIPDNWEEKLERTVFWELLENDINVNKTWYGKIKPTVTKFESPIMKYFQLDLYEKKFNGSKETVININLDIGSVLSSWVTGSIVETWLKNIYNAKSISVRIDKCRYSKINKNHYKQVISRTIATQIKQLVKTQVL